MSTKPKAAKTEAQQEAERRAAERKRLRYIESLRSIMATPEGRHFMHRLLTDARIFSPCYTGNSQTFYNEGRREFGLKYFNDLLQHTGAAYATMMQENSQPEEETHG